jgi:dihydroflavonol-4-reductase
MSSVFVTGATGFLGKHLVDRLIARGDSIVALVRGDEPALAAKGVKLAKGDVLDRESVIKAATGCTSAYHLAGKVSRKPEDAEELHRIHVEGTKIALDAMRAAGVKRVVVASTSGTVAVSKNPKEIIDESWPAPMELVSRWPYYRSKLFAEGAALDRSSNDFQVVCVNPTLLLGPGDDRESSTGDVVKFMEQKLPFVPGGGMSFVDVRDVADALVLAMDKGRAGDRYLLSAMNLTIEAFFKRLERATGVASPKLKVPRSMGLARLSNSIFDIAKQHVNIEPPVDKISAEMAQVFWYVDSSKAERELGWTPRDPGVTVADTVEDLRARGVVWPS